MHVYADDTIIYSHTNSIEQAVQQKAFQSLQMLRKANVRSF